MNKFMSFNATMQAAFDNDEAKFENFSKMLVDAAMNNLEEGVSMKEANAKIVSKFRAAIGCNENSTSVEIRKAIRRNQVELFDIIEDTIQDLLVSGWMAVPFFQKYVEVRNLALGDKNEFYIEDDSMLSVMEVSGNHHNIIRQRVHGGEKKSINTSWVAIKIYAEYERVLTGVEDWASFVMKIYEAYDNYLIQTMYDALANYANALATPYKVTGSLTDTDLRTLCDLISMMTGRPVVIMGTKVALRKVTGLQNANYISNDMKSEHYKTGLLGYWEGIELVEIQNRFKKWDFTDYVLENDMLFIMPVSDEKFIKVVNEGDSQIYSVTDPATNRDMTYEMEMQTKLGCAILTGSVFGVYKITA